MQKDKQDPQAKGIFGWGNEEKKLLKEILGLMREQAVQMAAQTEALKKLSEGGGQNVTVTLNVDVMNEILALEKEIKAEVFRQSEAAQATQLAEVNKTLEPSVTKLEQAAEPEAPPAA